MFKNETKTRMMAMAIVAMFMLTAFSIALVDEKADATTGDGSSASPYVITIRTGDNFSYPVTTNLEGTTFAAYQTAKDSSTYGSSALTSTSSTDVLAFNDTTNTLSGSFTNQGTYKVKIVATWNGPSGTSLTQTAEQYIQFNVIGHLELQDDLSVGISRGAMPAGNVIDEVTTKTTMAASNPSIAWTITSQKNSSESTVNIFELSSASGSSTNLRFISGTPDTGDYVVIVQATETYDNLTFSDTVTYHISVGMASTAAPVVITTYIGNTNASDNQGTTTFTSSGTFTPTAWDNAGSSDSNITFDTTSAGSVLSPKWSVQVSDGTGYGFSNTPTTTEAVSTASYTYVATGYDVLTNGNSDSYDVDVSFTYNVYAKLAFTSTPTMSGTTGYANQANPLEVLMSTNVGAAKKVVFNWGDGRQDVVETDLYDSFVTKGHTYTNAGLYTITTTAYNDFGNVSAVTLYNAGNDATISAPEMKEVTIKDGRDIAKLVGKVQVADGSSFKISQIVIDDDAQTYMEKKKIVALYTAAANSDGVFDATKKWNQGNQVFDNVTLYADIQPTTQVDDFFAEHGWLFIVFAVLFILSLFAIFYLGFQAPQFYAIAVVLLIVTILLFLYKDFGGIWDAITGLFH